MNKLHLSEEVQNDLLEIKTYIEEELLNPSAALATVSKITKSPRIWDRFKFCVNVKNWYKICE